MKVGNFVFYHQAGQMDCGPACLRMIAKHYGKTFSASTIRGYSETTREGASLAGLSKAAEKLGFHTLGVKIDFLKLVDEAPLPAIVHWNDNHYIVVYKIKNKKVYVADPAHGLITYTSHEFISGWIGQNATENMQQGLVLLIEPGPQLNNQADETNDSSYGSKLIKTYFNRYQKFFYQLFMGLVAVSILQLIVPFLTQSIVDVGIRNQDLSFVYLILAAQLFLFFGRISVEIIRSWILLHLSSRIKVSLVSDFFIKLMRLPISFFDTRLTGDIMQRINDHHRIEQLLTSSSLSTLFSMINLVVFGAVLAWYHLVIFSVFLVGIVSYFCWILLFIKKRKDLDYKRFAQISAEQSKVIELISGMQEIKLYNAERQKRWGWEYLQARLFRLEIKGLKLEQTLAVGSNFINELKNILITVFSATLVIKGQLTLGMMLSISYIIGQLNGPILQLVTFMHSLQDANIALGRLAEIHDKEDEEPLNGNKIHFVDTTSDLIVDHVTFRYTGSSETILRGISFTIPAKKVTAIVGASGSGKSTLMKLLLKFYEPDSGNIKLGSTDLTSVSQEVWRSHFGVVMQEGYIFNDSIASNIALGEDEIDFARLVEAVSVANIREFVESLPQSYNTKIGMEGIGMSTGQKQRLLIARAVYKNPDFLFFDEATSALDAKNERIIMENLQRFYKGKTAVIIAHRLSTVQHADQIVVINDGEIIEVGNHNSLVMQKGSYYNLVKNQLELGKLDMQKV